MGQSEEDCVKDINIKAEVSAAIPKPENPLLHGINEAARRDAVLAARWAASDPERDTTERKRVARSGNQLGKHGA